MSDFNPSGSIRSRQPRQQETKPDAKKTATRRRIEDILEQREQRRRYELG